MVAMKKVFLVLVLSLAFSHLVLAEGQLQGVLPNPANEQNCSEALKSVIAPSKRQETLSTVEGRQEILGCAVKTGDIHLWMIPFFITYLIEFIIGLAGLASVLFIVYGGFQYITGGLSDDKESGKKTIKFAIIGLLVSLVAWIIVNIIQVQVTR